MKRLLLLAISIYRVTLALWIGGACRFSPSCSCYAEEAVQRHGFCRGLWLTLKRLSRCQPFGPWGYDPVPEKFESDLICSHSQPFRINKKESATCPV